MDRQRTGNGTQQHSFNDVVVEFEARRLVCLANDIDRKSRCCAFSPQGAGWRFGFRSWK